MVAIKASCRPSGVHVAFPMISRPVRPCRSIRSDFTPTSGIIPLHNLSKCSKIPNYLTLQPAGGRFRFRSKSQRHLARALPVEFLPSIANSSETEALLPLGVDLLELLAATVVAVPLFKRLNLSPILAYLLIGFIFKEFHLIHDPVDLSKLSELGVLFLLFEMGLELSTQRLRTLFRYASLGAAQVLVTTLAFTLIALPVGNSIGTRLLEFLADSPASLVSIRSLDEAVVIGVALSLSSSAFVLSLLAEKGELPTRHGAATLGILLMQDIAVVPLLVLLPLIEGTGGLAETGRQSMTLLPQLLPSAAKAIGLLMAGAVTGRFVLRRVFELVAESRSSESFVALSLLTVLASSVLTQELGFSDTLGAFVAGVLLAETNYRTQIEVDLAPFRSLLLGLFFITTGTSLDLPLVEANWRTVIALLLGLIGIKTLITGTLAPFAGLSRAEAVRTALLLSQGGEFAFVALSLALNLNVLPNDTTKLLTAIVVLSMALTPALAEAARIASDSVEAWEKKQRLAKSAALGGGGETSDDLIGTSPWVPSLSKSSPAVLPGGEEDSDRCDLLPPWGRTPVVICGFGPAGQVVSNMLASPLASVDGRIIDLEARYPFVAFDLDATRVRQARELGLPVIYGDGARREVLEAAGIERPTAIVVTYNALTRSTNAVHALRESYPDVPIYARAHDLVHAGQLMEAGASSTVTEDAEAGLQLGSNLLVRVAGSRQEEVVGLKAMLRQSFEAMRASMANSEERDKAVRQLQILTKLQRAPEMSGQRSEATANAMVNGGGGGGGGGGAKEPSSPPGDGESLGEAYKMRKAKVARTVDTLVPDTPSSPPSSPSE